MVPAGGLFPLFALGLYGFMGVLLGFVVAAIAALFRNVRPSAVAVDLVVGGVGGLIGAVIVGWASTGLTSFVNGRWLQDGWRAVVVEHEFSIPAAFVLVLVIVAHLLVATRHRVVRDAA